MNSNTISSTTAKTLDLLTGTECIPLSNKTHIKSQVLKDVVANAVNASNKANQAAESAQNASNSLASYNEIVSGLSAGGGGQLTEASVVAQVTLNKSDINDLSENVSSIIDTLNITEDNKSYKITNITLVNTPARNDGVIDSAGRYKGYTVDLSSLYQNGYRLIFFKGSEYTKSSNICKGLILLSDNTVESYTPFNYKYSSGWQSLPITSNSVKLKATYPTDENYSVDGLWTPEYVYCQKEFDEDNKISQLLNNINELSNNIKFDIEQVNNDISTNKRSIDYIKNVLSITSVTKELIVTQYDEYNSMHPATITGLSTSYVGYYDGIKIDLTGKYNLGYRYVNFRGSEGKNSSAICRGVITKADGSVESYAKTNISYTNGWQDLPITEESKYLWCTRLNKEDYLDELWDFEYVTFKPETQDENIINKMNSDISTIKEELNNNGSIERIKTVLKINNSLDDVYPTYSKIKYCARNDGSNDIAGYYAGYEVDLLGYYNQGYKYVSFYGSDYTKSGTIVRGLIYKEDGSVECTTSFLNDRSTSLSILPLTTTSYKLRASYCTNTKGGNIFDFDSVDHVVTISSEFNSNVIDEINERLDDIESSITESSKFVPLTFLPTTIYGVVNETLQLFKRGVCSELIINNYINRFSSTVNGKTYNRYAEIKPLESGEFNLHHYLYDVNYNQLDKITTNFKICNKPTTSPSSEINVLCVGASTSSQGHWEYELKRRLTTTTSVDSKGNSAPTGLGLSNINFVGRKNLNNVNFEATGGWTWKRYISKGVKSIRFIVSGVNVLSTGDILYYTANDGKTASVSVSEVNVTDSSGNIMVIFSSSTPTENMPNSSSGQLTKKDGSKINYSEYTEEYYSPFYDTSTNKMNFTKYMNDYASGKSINVCIVWLGLTNEGIYGQEDFSSVISNMKTFIDSLHSEYPSCKVMIIPDAGKSFDSGVEFNASLSKKNTSHGARVAAFRYGKAIDEFVNNASYKSFCYIVNTIAEVDAEYAFPTAEKAVNTRMPNTKEIYGSNGAHLTYEGYMMVADSVYRCFVNEVLN